MVDAESPQPSPGTKCNRAACQRPGPTWWNPSTRAWYCPRCARAINEHSPGLCISPTIPRGEWIPVEERLPYIFEVVWVYVPSLFRRADEWAGMYRKGRYLHDLKEWIVEGAGGLVEGRTVTHWMPIVEGPDAPAAPPAKEIRNGP